MKRFIIFMIFVAAAIAAIFLTVFVLSPPAPSGLSPEETVRYYYAQWNTRNNAGMNSVVHTPMRYQEDFSGMISIKLLTCEEITDPDLIREGFETEWYEQAPYQIAYVDTTFDIELREDSNTGFENGLNYCGYFLVKDSENSDWIIVSWGQG